MKRTILHCDINHCYAQIEEMKNPALREVPMAVGGSEESRHGIILAKNDLAKKYGIKTGESLREAYRKCPDLRIVPPHYQEYLYYTEKIKDVYRLYSDQVESFGLDEAWVDLTSTQKYGENGILLAHKIQQQVYDEFGITISVGVSFNKVFAKFGSDMKKPYGFVIINEMNYKHLLWHRPVEELFYVGKKTAVKLHSIGIWTIGDLARSNLYPVKKLLGKVGEMIWLFANGEDVSPVAFGHINDPVKSIGNGITTKRDVCNPTEAKWIFYVLAESVAARLKQSGLVGRVVHISLRDTQLKVINRQKKRMVSTNISDEIVETANELLLENYSFYLPLRSLSLSVSDLSEEKSSVQLSFLIDQDQRQKQKRLDEVVEVIREKYGYDKAFRCSMKVDSELTDFNPKKDHIIHPVGFF